LIYVGKDHPLADCRGNAYEHRLKAEAKKGQFIHHDNEKKGDNSKRNLIKTTRRFHLSFHRKPGSKLRKRGESNPMVKCACGCGTTFRRYDKEGLGRPRKYIAGHNPHPAPISDAILKALGLKARTTQVIIKTTGLPARSISSALNKLKRNGQIVRFKESNPIIKCLCGCGRNLSLYDKYDRARHFISGHNPHGIDLDNKNQRRQWKWQRKL